MLNLLMYLFLYQSRDDKLINTRVLFLLYSVSEVDYIDEFLDIEPSLYKSLAIIYVLLLNCLLIFL